MRALLTLLLMGAIAMSAAGPAEAGGLNLFKLNKSDEADIAKQMNEEYKKDPGLITKGKQYDQVQRVGKRLVTRNGLAEYNYRFFLVNDDSVNAFATPGGYIYVHKGLVDIMGYDEAMLASVMAHELGHAKDRHPTKGYEKQATGGAAIGLLGAIIGGKGKGKGKGELITSLLANAGALMYLKYNRDQEEWADRSGVTLAYGAGYDAYGMARGLQCLEQLYGNSSKAQNIFENHPPNAARITRTIEIAHETAGRPHGYSAVPLPPKQDHPLYKLYGPQGVERLKLGKSAAVVSDQPPVFAADQSSDSSSVDVPVTKRGG